jgi:hypothetical protein
LGDHAQRIVELPPVLRTQLLGDLRPNQAARIGDRSAAVGFIGHHARRAGTDETATTCEQPRLRAAGQRPPNLAIDGLWDAFWQRKAAGGHGRGFLA